MQQKIAYIDLSRNNVSLFCISDELRRKFLGGRGLNVYLLHHLCTPEVAPLAPENPLIIGAGLVTGCHCPSPSRTQITGKSPETGLLGDSNFGGHFGAALRKTGIDHLVFLSKAANFSYALVTPNKVQVLDACWLWGLDTYQAQEALKKEYGRQAQALCIGPAGENLVRFACIRHDLKSTAGRGGLGCLMGSKRLKAVVVLGGERPKQAFPEELKDYTKVLNQRISSTKTSQVLREHGTPFLFDLHNFQGIVRTRNAQTNKFRSGKKIRSSVFKKYYTGKKACFGCKIACRHSYTLNEAGPDYQAVGPEYGTLGAFGPICGIDNPEAILRLNDQVNRLGLDSSSTGNIIAWAMQLFEQGLLSTKDTDGLNLRWGDDKVILELVRCIAYVKGFGALLAKGPREAAQIIGKDSDNYLIWSKNLLQSDSVDLRAHKGFALGVATSSRGADHLRSRPTMEALQLSETELSRIYQAEIGSEPTSYLGKARMVWQSELEYALADALGICRFAQRFNSPEHLDILELKQLTELATGLEFSEPDFWQIGERILTLERSFLHREGLDKRSDSLPDIYYQPMPEGIFKGERIEKGQFEIMLNEYYSLHGWDIQDGMPTNTGLRSLGLND